MQPFIRSDLVEIISGYTDLTNHGSYLIGCCPIHDDTTPSLVVYPNDGPDTARWLCYGCHPKASDVIAFVRLVEGCSFQAALKICASQITTNEAFIRELEKQQESHRDELFLYAIRANAMTKKYDLSECNQVFEQLDGWIETGKLFKCDKLLSAYGV